MMSDPTLPASTTVRLDTDTRRMLDEMARNAGVSLSDVIRLAVRSYHETAPPPFRPALSAAVRGRVKP